MANMEAAPAPLVYRSREAAKALGISERTLWQMTKDGHIPSVRFGGGKCKTALYPVAELEAWLSNQSKVEGGAK